MPRLRSLVAASDSYTSSSIDQRPPGEAPRARRRCARTSPRAKRPGTRLVVASAPALTIGFMVRSSLSSMPITESKGNPVLLTPSLRRASAGPRASQHQGEDEELRDALDGELLLGVADGEDAPVHAGHAHAEGVGRAPRPGRGCSRPPSPRRGGESARSPPRRSPAPRRRTGGSRSRCTPRRGRARRRCRRRS